LCEFSEYKVGDVVTECDEGEVVCVPLLDGNGFLKVNDKLPSAGQLIDPNIVCTFSGTFRASSAMDDGNMFHPIPLATSNGCPTTTTNFQTVVKGMVKEDGNLELDFSGDYGESYYTENKTCPYSYIGQTSPDDIEGQGRALARKGHVNRRLCPHCFVLVGFGVAIVLQWCLFGILCSMPWSETQKPTSAPTTKEPTNAPTTGPTSGATTAEPTSGATTAGPTSSATTAGPTSGTTTAGPTSETEGREEDDSN
jgi:hypothetical protein